MPVQEASNYIQYFGKEGDRKQRNVNYRWQIKSRQKLRLNFIRLGLNSIPKLITHEKIVMCAIKKVPNYF